MNYYLHESHLPSQCEQETHSYTENQNPFTDCQQKNDNNSYNYQEEKHDTDIYVEHKSSNEHFEQPPLHVIQLQSHHSIINDHHSQLSHSKIHEIDSNSIKSHSSNESHSISQENSQSHVESDTRINENVATNQNDIERPDEGNQVGESKTYNKYCLCIWGSCDVWELEIGKKKTKIRRNNGHGLILFYLYFWVYSLLLVFA